MEFEMKKVRRFAISLFCLLTSFFIPRNKKMIAFGSWMGEVYIDNSRYLLEEALHELGKEYRFIWIGNSELKKQLPQDVRISLIKKNSIKSIFVLLRCKYMFCSQHRSEDICYYNVYHRAVVVYLHHGFPIKRWGCDAVSYNMAEQNKSILSGVIKNIFHVIVPIDNYSYFIASSDTQKKNFLTALSDRGCRNDNILCTGTPRNDMFYTLTLHDRIELKNKYAKLLGFDRDKKVILYLPTFRRSGVKTESLYVREDEMEKGHIIKMLRDNNSVLIEKIHFVEEHRISAERNTSNDKNYIKVPSDVNVQELLMITDVLISDYSGAFVDFLLLDRPIIHYVYDYEFYRDIDSGLYYDIDQFASGFVAYTYGKLLDRLHDTLNESDCFKELRKERRDFFMHYEKGMASKQIIKRIILEKMD